MGEVGKKLRELYEAMLGAYRQADDKEQGARAALEIYYENEADVREISRILGEVEDLHNMLVEALRRLQEERAKTEKRSVTIRGKGCLVVKLVPCGKNCSGCPHGPYAYEVHKIGGKQVWKYLGKA